MSEQPVIICAVDLSWRSQAAFTQAVALAKSRGARLNVVFAVPFRRPLNWRVRERVALLAELRRQASMANIDMTVSVQHGNPADVILTHADSVNPVPDWIVIGAPSRRGIERFRWSSVSTCKTVTFASWPRNGQCVSERSLRRFGEIYGTKNSPQRDHFKASILPTD